LRGSKSTLAENLFFAPGGRTLEHLAREHTSTHNNDNGKTVQVIAAQISSFFHLFKSRSEMYYRMQTHRSSFAAFSTAQASLVNQYPLESELVMAEFITNSKRLDLSEDSKSSGPMHSSVRALSGLGLHNPARQF
jgi:hypothetical protein